MASQKLPSLHSGVKATLVPGDPMARAMGQYGKGHDPLAAAQDAGLPSAVDEHPGGPAFRGGAGGIKPHAKLGGIAAGKAATLTAPPFETDQGIK